MILKDFSSIRPRFVFCMVSFVKKICVLACREIRESGPTALHIIFLNLQILGQISSHIFLEHSKFVEIYRMFKSIYIENHLDQFLM